MITFIVLTDAQDDSSVYINVDYMRSFVWDDDHTTIVMGEEIVYHVKELPEFIAVLLKEIGSVVV